MKKTFSKFAAACALLLTLSASAFAADFTEVKPAAEKLYAEGSFSKAREAYLTVNTNGLSIEDHRWTLFRIADTQWRARSASKTRDDTPYQEAHKGLAVLERDITREEDQDLVWAEVHESLGDYHWTTPRGANWGAAKDHYFRALNWWAGSPDLEVARVRYISIIQRIAEPKNQNRHYYYGYYGNQLPLNIIENYLKIVRTPADRAHAHFLMAMTLRQTGDWTLRSRVATEFELAIGGGRGTGWLDDALFSYAQWMEQTGAVAIDKNGHWKNEPDYVKALSLYRSLVRSFKKGESRHFDQAQRQIKRITDPTLNVRVSNVFLPGSKIQYHAGWRNLKAIKFDLLAVDLSRDVQLKVAGNSRPSWIDGIDLAKAKSVKSWTHDTEDAGKHKPGSDAPWLKEDLPPGAYVLRATSEKLEARDIVLVSDASIVLKTAGTQVLAYLCDSVDGSPLEGANIQLSQRWRVNRQGRTKNETKTTNKDGVAIFDLAALANSVQLFVGANSDNRQAFSTGNQYSRSTTRDGQWRIYAHTDRPAYRPKETVQWKFIAREHFGGAYTTPANAKIRYEITDPRRTKIEDKTVSLNDFGSAWGKLELTEKMPLGEYRVRFFHKDADQKERSIGGATLFRLEEYKLPEFKVAVETPKEDGRPKIFRLGEKVEVDIQSDYYFGGPVAEAKVEIHVYQKPFHHTHTRPRDFPWFYENMAPGYRNRSGGKGQSVHHEIVKTDATGKATITFETPGNTGQDFEYTVEARVTDSSRREIVGSGSVRVTRQPYYVHTRADHNLYRPKQEVKVEFVTQDANDQPLAVEGKVKVVRRVWKEVWLAPNGREVTDGALSQLKAARAVFPPPAADPDQNPWRLKTQGYEDELVSEQNLKTGDDGKTNLTFTPERAGYYAITWTSSSHLGEGPPKRPPFPITAQTAVWVSDNNSTAIGFHNEEIDIIVDKDTFTVGQKAPVMLHSPKSGRYVLFCVEGEKLHSYQLVHIKGTAKLVQLDITEEHVPNIFLHAAMVSDNRLSSDQEQIVVPPTKNFLTVDVSPDREEYQPRQEGFLNLTARDHNGKPVAAEISLRLVDESVFYIQSDYAGDPRQFYYGTKRSHRIGTRGSFNDKNYIKWVFVKDHGYVDEREVAFLRSNDLEEQKELRMVNGVDVLNTPRVSRFNGRVSDGRSMDKSTAMSAMAPASAMASAIEGSSMSRSGDAMPAPAMKAKRAAPGGGGGGAESAVVVRSDFRSTILWRPDVVTDKHGKARVKVTYPDSLTGWKATARFVTRGNQFGVADTATRTKNPLIVRLQAPRFFVVGDTVVISAVINNNTSSNLTVGANLEVEGLKIEGFIPETPNGKSVKRNGFLITPYPMSLPKVGVGGVQIPANSEKRVDWLATVEKAGAVKIRTIVRQNNGALADAMEKKYIAHEHGIEKFVNKAGKVRGKDVTVNLNIPKERKKDSTTLTVQIAPSMAVTMLDALPYLIDYPYGCTEQTLSRFLPAAITAKTLRDLGLKPEDVMGRAFGGIEQAHVDKTQPKGKRDLAKLDAITKQSLDRLYDFQHADGGWGWWKQGESDHFMTAYVIWGFALAKQAGIEVSDSAFNRGVAWLDKELVEQELNFDNQAWMLHALAATKGGGSNAQNTAFENLWKNRTRLNAYSRSLLALSAHYYEDAVKAKILIANLENGVKKDARPDQSVLIADDPASRVKDPAAILGTAHWGEDGIYHRWSDGGVEATAFALRALLAIDPKNALVEPVTNWLIKNRRGAQWSNTRDTSIAVLAMNDYLRASGELEADVEYTLTVNGQRIAIKSLSGADVFNEPSKFVIDQKHIRDGVNKIRIKRKNGDSPLYFAVAAEYFSLEEPIPAAGNEIFVRRDYHKLVGRPTLLKGLVYEKQPLNDGDTVVSGERIEVVLTVEAKNNYEYLVFEDLKPAGLEAVQIRSGESIYMRELKSGAVKRKFTGAGQIRKVAAANGPSTLNSKLSTARSANYTGTSRWVHQELRDRKVALFIDKLPEGVWEIRYTFRAEVPGAFHALPVLGHAMYVPEIRCNGAEVRVTVLDKKD
jgi:uncharacterized protein YfaS (alpha-2-macroglobulin family)